MFRPERQYPLLIVPGMCDMGLGALTTSAFAASLGWRAHAVPLKQDLNELSSLSFQGYVEKVKNHETLRRHNKVVFLGHSMGGLIALKVAEEMPEQVAAVIMLESAPPKGIFPISEAALPRMWKYVHHIALGQSFQPSPDDIEALWLNCVRKEKRERLLRSYVRESGRAMRDILCGVSIDPNEISMPVLVAAGEHDLMLPLSIQRKIATYLGTKLITLPHGHQPMHEEGWEESLKKLLDWAAFH